MKRMSQPETKMLRSFGITSGLIVIVLFGAAIPWLRDSVWPLWPWVLSAILCLTGLLVPTALTPVYRVWMKFGHYMNRLNTTIILTFVYFVVFTPVSLFMRIIGRDVLNRKFDPGASSYRINSTAANADRMEKPF